MADKQFGFGFAQTQVMGKDEWLTPPEIIRSLGEFDLDPCSPIDRPWPTAKNHFTIQDDGLLQEWTGRVWLNPPYGKFVWQWLYKLSQHKNGIALIFSRTGTAEFHNQIWQKAHSLLFIKGRLHFHHVNGDRAPHNCGADSVLISYDSENTKVLQNCSIEGKFIQL